MKPRKKNVMGLQKRCGGPMKMGGGAAKKTRRRNDEKDARWRHG